MCFYRKMFRGWRKLSAKPYNQDTNFGSLGNKSGQMGQGASTQARLLSFETGG